MARPQAEPPRGFPRGGDDRQPHSGRRSRNERATVLAQEPAPYCRTGFQDCGGLRPDRRIRKRVRRHVRRLTEMSMNTRTLNLTDDHRRLYLQHSEDEPTLVCVLLFCEERPVAYAHADVQRCRFSMSSDGLLFWVGDTSFVITEQERWQIEEFLAQCREYREAVK